MTPFTHEPESYDEYEAQLDSLYELQIDRQIAQMIDNQREANETKIQSRNGSGSGNQAEGLSTN